MSPQTVPHLHILPSMLTCCVMGCEKTLMCLLEIALRQSPTERHQAILLRRRSSTTGDTGWNPGSWEHWHHDACSRYRRYKCWCCRKWRAPFCWSPWRKTTEWWIASWTHVLNVQALQQPCNREALDLRILKHENQSNTENKIITSYVLYHMIRIFWFYSIETNRTKLLQVELLLLFHPNELNIVEEY